MMGKTGSLLLLAVVLAAIPTYSYSNSELTDVRVAVRAHVNEQRATNKWQATLEHLNQHLSGYRFVLRPYTSIKQQIDDGKKQAYEFVLTNPSTYVELEIATGATALVTLINNRKGTAQTRFGSVIFTHVENTDVLSLADLKGKTFIGVTPRGFGGWRVALKEFLDQGINPHEDFASLQFAGSQTAVVDAVKNKSATAGVVRTDMLERLADQGKINLTEFRILNQQNTSDFPFFHSSALYPEWPLAVMPHTDKELANQVRDILINIRPTDTAAVKGKYMGWTNALAYAPVKQLLRQLDLIPADSDDRTGSASVLILVLVISLAALLLYSYMRRAKRQ